MNLLLYYFLSILTVTTALFEDQVGKFEWRQQYVGRVLHSYIDISSPTKKLIVGTEKNVVAALSLKSGEILWRQILEENEEITIKAMFFGTDVVTISGAKQLLARGWDFEHGHLKWEWSLNRLAEDMSSGFWLLGEESLAFIIPAQGGVQVQWYRLRSGELLKKDEVIVSGVSSDACVVVKGEHLVCYSQQILTTISVRTVGDARVVFKTLSDVPSEASLKAVDGSFPAVELQHQNTRLIVGVSPEITISPVKTEPGKLIASALVDGKNLIFALDITNQLANVDSFGSDGTAISYLKSSFLWPTGTAPPDFLNAKCQARIDGSVACRLVVTCLDHTLAVLQHPGSILWKREEALASIISAEIVHLPLSEADAALDNEFQGHMWQLGRRLTTQWQQLTNLLLTVLGVNRKESGGPTGLTRDDFGLHKVIIAVTKPGKILGIDNLSGEIVWQKNALIQPILAANGRLVYPLYVLRSAFHPRQTAELAILGNASLLVIDPINGALVEPVIQLPYRVRQVTPLHVSDDKHRRPLLLLDDQNKVHVYPQSATKLAEEVAHSVFLYTVDTNTGWMTGYRLRTKDSSGLTAVEAWKLNLGQDDAKIVAVAPKRDQERVHSQGRVLGDRSVLYKYVNPNLVAVLTQGYHPSHKLVVNVYLVDVVSGLVVATCSQRRAREPVFAVHAENWLVYSWVSEKNRRTEIAALELYEGTTQTNASVFSSLTAPPLLPLVEKQAYILPSNIRTMRDTVTEKGITSKHILVALASGGILELPWAYVDPRRTIIVTPEMREEGVVPYMPELPIPMEAIVNHNQSIAHIRNVVAAPSGLESTSLIFAYGLDLFCSRISPSKTFDLLKENFDYFLITAVLTGLSVSSLITRKLASRKALKQAWK